ncbi:MAG TPA: GNAT family N-acetyltransferase [Acidiphilium sp.]
MASLDDYLRHQAGQHQRDGIATTHVLVDESAPPRILGYCTLAAAQLELQALQPADRKRLPRHPVPAVRVARLAVAQDQHARGYGRLLLGHAVNSGLMLRGQLGVKAIVVDALDDRAASFYRAYGFRETAHAARTLYLSLGKS